jgi:hypothetical protein
MSVATQYMTTRGSNETVAVPRLVPAQSIIATRPAVPVSVLFLGAVAAVVGAWGAAAPFAGPDFGYVADRFGAWQWSVTSGCLGLGPGALALLASLAVVAMATRTSYARRADLWVLGLVVTLCGAWFVVGQYVWPVIYGTRFIVPSNATHYMWKELAFAIGPGVILVFCGAVFMGWAVRRQLALVAAHLPRAAAPSEAGKVVTGVVPAATAVEQEGTVPAVGNTGTMAPPGTGVAEPPVGSRVAEPPVASPIAEPLATGVVERESHTIERPISPT